MELTADCKCNKFFVSMKVYAIDIKYEDRNLFIYTWRVEQKQVKVVSNNLQKVNYYNYF